MESIQVSKFRLCLLMSLGGILLSSRQGIGPNADMEQWAAVNGLLLPTNWNPNSPNGNAPDGTIRSNTDQQRGEYAVRFTTANWWLEDEYFSINAIDKFQDKKETIQVELFARILKTKSIIMHLSI